MPMLSMKVNDCRTEASGLSLRHQYINMVQTQSRQFLCKHLKSTLF